MYSQIQVPNSQESTQRKFQPLAAIALAIGIAYLATGAGAATSEAEFKYSYGGQWGSLCSFQPDPYAGGYSLCQQGFDYPADIASDSAGNIYVADSENNRIVKFDQNGSFLAHWGGPEKCTYDADNTNGVPDNPCIGEFDNPGAIAIDSKDNIYIVDADNNRIVKFDSARQFVKQLGGATAQACVFDNNYDNAIPNNPCIGKFNYPLGITTGANDDIYVVDSQNNRIQRFASDSAFISQWGDSSDCYFQPDSSSPGHNPCQYGFRKPYDIDADSDGNLFVSDLNNNRIVKYNYDGTYLNQWGGPVPCIFDNDTTNAITDNACVGEFNRPSGIAVSSKGVVSIADTYNARIEAFDTSGAYLGQFGGSKKCVVDLNTYPPATCDGQFFGPVGVDFGSTDNMYVVDPDNYRIERFVLYSNGLVVDPPEPPPAPTPDTTSPVIKGFKTTRKRLRRVYIRKKRTKRTSFKYRLSENAKVKLVIKAKRARRVCKKSKNGKRRCKRTRVITKRTANGTTGRNRIRVKIKSRKLRPGLYTATLVAVDVSGNRSIKKRTNFRVVKRRAKTSSKRKKELLSTQGKSLSIDVSGGISGKQYTLVVHGNGTGSCNGKQSKSLTATQNRQVNDLIASIEPLAKARATYEPNPNARDIRFYKAVTDVGEINWADTAKVPDDLNTAVQITDDLRLSLC